AADKKIWYGEMRIPIDKIDRRKPQAGQELRINFYRFQGPPPDRKRIAWQPTGNDNYHTPEAFGLLRMEKGGEWGVGSGEEEINHRGIVINKSHSPLPTPHSPVHFPFGAVTTGNTMCEGRAAV